jgi:GNAT superfamily N-acetyltransferase
LRPIRLSHAANAIAPGCALRQGRPPDGPGGGQMNEVALEITDAPAAADKEAVRDGLITFCDRFLGPCDLRPIAVFVRGPRGLQAGLVGETGRGVMKVALLWVTEELRGQGIGTRVLLAAEAEATARGCRKAILDTYDFQARPFYERHGYRVFSEIDGYTNGHRSFLMAKDLVTPRPARAT